MFSKTFIAAAFAGLAASAPAVSRRDDSGTFTIFAIDSGTTIQYATINANGYNFWIGKPTTSSSPDPASDYPAGNVTALAVYTTALGGASTDTEVPGGQFIFAAADGALGYTVPHSGAIPAGATSGPFVYVADSYGEGIGNLKLAGNDFFACPTLDPSIYQIYADVPGFVEVGCNGILIDTEPFEGVAAWEYV